MKIKFLPQNIEIESTPEKSLMQLATENGLEIRSICKGVPQCAECRVRIVEGDTNILPPTKAELSLIGTNYFIDGRRLSCQVRCFGDVTVDLTEQIEKSETQTKKIRGFRTAKQVESKAVNDTLLLDEKTQLQETADSKLSDDETASHEPSQNLQRESRGGSHKGPQQNKKNDQNREAKGGGGREKRDNRQRSGRGGGGGNPQAHRQQKSPQQGAPSQNQNKKK